MAWRGRAELTAVQTAGYRIETRGDCLPKDREYELKFRLEPGDAGRLAAHPILAAAMPERNVSAIVSTYFDTPDGALQARRLSLRVRRAADGTIHTLKRAGGSFVDRDEWERADPAGTPAVTWLRETPAGAIFRKTRIARTLGPRFTVAVTRTRILIRGKDSLIEGALDQGTIRTATRTLPVDEFELELKRGRPEAVRALARSLATALPLTLSLASKAERGSGLAEGSWGHPTKALTLELAAASTRAEAFERIVQACLHALLLNAALVGGDATLEATHKARIALRRLRAAIALFRPILRKNRLKALQGSIRWLSRRLGAARDADVFLAHIEGTTVSSAPVTRDQGPGAAALADILRAGQRKAQARLREALASKRWRLLLLDLLAFSADGLKRAERQKRFRPFVTGRLAQGRRALACRGRRGLSHLSPRERHAVRKAAKMLRYDLDFVADVRKVGAGTKRFRHLQADLQTMQDTLGRLHDRDALHDHLRESLEGGAPAIGFAPDAWRSAKGAADAMAAAPTDTDRLLRKANKALRRIADSASL